jgi:DNA replication and repair protein RecF
VPEPTATIVSLSLRDFRNFERLQLEFPAEGFALIGDNGQGKTNLLEAAYYLSLLRSMRGARDADVVRFGADGFFIEAKVCAPDAHEVGIGFERAGRRKRVRRDGTVVDRLGDALGTIPAVIFSPADVELIGGGPAARRRFLDIMLALSAPPRGYLHSLQQYRAALERRNATLRGMSRTPAPNTAAIEVWEAPLAEHGAMLIRARRAWVARVAARFSERCSAIGGDERVELRYETGVNPNAESVEGALSEALAAKRTADVRHGVTHVGPHRDDLIVTIGGHELRTFGSAGQQRTAAIVLRTLEAETLRDARSVSPVFLMDDPFAELDARRAARVLRLLREVGLGQTILAVPRASDVPDAMDALPRFRLDGGTIRPMTAAS